jgi:hypothetical protein
MEGDKEIFKTILEPLIEVFKKQQLDTDGAVEDLGDEELPPLVIVPRNQYCN